MFKKEFYPKLEKFTNITTTDINDKVGRDFLKFLVSSENIKISSELFEKFIEGMKIIAACNNHKFIRQSDLFAMLEIEQDEVKNLQEIFEKVLKVTMFRELNIYLEANILFKDQATIDFENNAITEEQIEQATLLINWTTAKIKELENSIELVVNGEQLTNILTGVEVSKFYEQTIAEIVTMLKWHLIGFQIIKNFKRK